MFEANTLNIIIFSIWAAIKTFYFWRTSPERILAFAYLFFASLTFALTLTAVNVFALAMNWLEEILPNTIVLPSYLPWLIIMSVDFFTSYKIGSISSSRDISAIISREFLRGGFFLILMMNFVAVLFLIIWLATLLKIGS